MCLHGVIEDVKWICKIGQGFEYVTELQNEIPARGYDGYGLEAARKKKQYPHRSPQLLFEISSPSCFAICKDFVGNETNHPSILALKTSSLA